MVPKKMIISEFWRKSWHARTNCLHILTGTRWFDAEIYDGTNIGRFANQKGVIDTLSLALRQADTTTFLHMDWKVVNEYASSLANAKFQVSRNELHVVANEDIPPSARPTEIFVCYGPTEDYWIPLIASRPSEYPAPLRRVVRLLLTSEHSNWTDEQKERWSGLTLEQIRQEFY